MIRTISIILLVLFVFRGHVIAQNKEIIFQIPKKVEETICTYINSDTLDIKKGIKLYFFCQWNSENDTVSLLISEYFVYTDPEGAELIKYSNRYIQMSNCDKIKMPILSYSDIYQSTHFIMESKYIPRQRALPVFTGLQLKFVYDAKNYPEGIIIDK